MRLCTIILFYLCFNFFQCFLLRLPCGYKANFTIKHVNKYFTSAKIIITETIETLQYCVWSCVSNPACVSINFKEETKQCQLLPNITGRLEARQNWIFFTYDMQAINNGPYCTEIQPCGMFKKCTDTCDNDRYECEDYSMANVALGKTVTLSSSHSSFLPSNCVDNDFTTFCHTSASGPTETADPWLKLDLASLYRIFYIRINVRGSAYDRVNDWEIFIENTSKQFFALIANTKQQQVYSSMDKRFVGRYIYLFHKNRNNGGSYVLNFNELEVFGVEELRNI